MTVVWSSVLSRRVALVAEFAPSLGLPPKVIQTCSPLITIFGLGVVVWWRNRRDGAGTRRFVEVAVEMVRCCDPPIAEFILT